MNNPFIIPMVFVVILLLIAALYLVVLGFQVWWRRKGVHLNYKFQHWVFQWRKDEEGDIVFSIAGVLHFIKYKEHTIFKFGRRNYESAPKWVKL